MGILKVTVDLKTTKWWKVSVFRSALKSANSACRNEQKKFTWKVFWSAAAASTSDAYKNNIKICLFLFILITYKNHSSQSQGKEKFNNKYSASSNLVFPLRLNLICKWFIHMYIYMAVACRGIWYSWKYFCCKSALAASLVDRAADGTGKELHVVISTTFLAPWHYPATVG